MKKDIAIIGMAGRFPGAANIGALLENLKKGRKASSVIKKKRLSSCKLPINRKYFEGGFLDEIDKFDYRFFNLLKKEADLMSPSQRLLLETVYESIENSGYSINNLNNTRTGIFMAQGNNDYSMMFKERSTLSTIGDMGPFALARIVKYFNFNGMSTILRTECSSGIVALHSACKELICGDADNAIVCGAWLYPFPFLERQEFNDEIISTKGISCSFSGQANGMTRSESVVALMLKPLEQAIEDGDTIHSVIKSTSVNSGASSMSPTVPNAISLAENFKITVKKANISLNDIGFIEAHGAGTKLGDSIEVDSFNIALKDLSEEKIPISSIKANIGHTMGCAGLVGLVKAVLSIKHGYIFPTPNYKTESEVIDLRKSKIRISKKLEKWPQKHKKRNAVVSSIGVSGVNAHALIAEAPKRDIVDNNEKEFLLTFSAKSKNSLKKWLLDFDNFIENKNLRLADISYTLNLGRPHYKHRYAVLTSTSKSLKESINDIVCGDKIVSLDEKAPKLIFLFTEYKSISKQTIKSFLKKYKFLKEEYALLAKNKNIANLGYLNFIYQYSFYNLLKKAGIESVDFLGIGMGDMICDYIGKDFSREDTIKKVLKYDFKKINNLDKRIKLLIERETKEHNVIFVAMGHNNNIINKFKKESKNNDKFTIIHSDGDADNINQPLLLIKKLYLKGVHIDWKLFSKIYSGNKIELPQYKFEKTSCWAKEGEFKYFDADNVEELENDKKIFIDKENENLDTIFYQELVIIWKKVLKNKSLDLDKDFFENGGDSLLSTVLIKEVNNKFGVALDFEDIYQFSTINKLSEFLKRNIDNEYVLKIFWQDVLGYNDVSFNDNFFNLGGYSLLATQMIIQIKNHFSVDISFDDLYKNPTFGTFLNLIEKKIQENSKNNIDSQFVTEKIKGGVPFTALRDFIMGGGLKIRDKVIRIECEEVNFVKLNSAVDKVSEIYPDISFNFLVLNGEGNIEKSKVSKERIKETKNFKNIDLITKKLNSYKSTNERELNIMTINADGKQFLFFLYDKKSINVENFEEILKNVQRFYNLALVNHKYSLLDIKNGKKNIYTPEVELSSLYGCEYSSMLAMFKWIKKDFFYYKSLFPALDFACLPNLYFFSDTNIKVRPSNAEILGYDNVYKAQNVFIETKDLKNRKKAEEYYKKIASKNEVIMIQGFAKDLFFSRLYNNEKLSNTNVSLLVPRTNMNPLIHSPNLQYFGDIPIKSLWKFWGGDKRFKVIEVLKSSKIVSQNHGMLKVALSKVIKEYFRAQVVEGDGARNVYIGKSAYQLYEKSIQDSIDKKACISDIMMLNLIKMLERPMIIFRDLLIDLSLEEKEFAFYVKKTEDLLLKWEKLFFDMSSTLNNKGISFEPRISTPPDESLFELKIFTIKQKEYLLNEFKKIHVLHDKLMEELKNNL